MLNTNPNRVHCSHLPALHAIPGHVSESLAHNHCQKSDEIHRVV